jgi:four helix bundle protein
MTRAGQPLGKSGTGALPVRYDLDSIPEEVLWSEDAPDGESSFVNEGRFDLEERTASFGEAIIEFVQSLPVNAVTAPLISQIVRSGTSIGANYCEADDAVSKKEFRLKINTCKKEARETKYWLRMIAKASPSSKEQARPLWQEGKELHLIFCAILKSSRAEQQND